jgi:hypothetical protein
MNFNLPTKFTFSKRIATIVVLIFINTVVVISISYAFIQKLNDVDLDVLKQKINLVEDTARSLNIELNSLEEVQTFDKFDLAKQSQVFKNIVSVFGVKTTINAKVKKGIEYIVIGSTDVVAMIAYKINKAIESNTLKAEVKNLLINGNQSVLKVQIFGVDNEK